MSYRHQYGITLPSTNICHTLLSCEACRWPGGEDEEVHTLFVARHVGDQRVHPCKVAGLHAQRDCEDVPSVDTDRHLLSSGWTRTGRKKVNVCSPRWFPWSSSWKKQIVRCSTSSRTWCAAGTGTGQCELPDHTATENIGIWINIVTRTECSDLESSSHPRIIQKHNSSTSKMSMH